MNIVAFASVDRQIEWHAGPLSAWQYIYIYTVI